MAKPRIRGYLSLRLNRYIGLSLPIADAIEVVKDVKDRAAKAIGDTSIGKRVRARAAEKRRVRVDTNVLDAEIVDNEADSVSQDELFESAEKTLVAMGFTRTESKRAVRVAREAVEEVEDEKQAVVAALRALS